MIIRMFGPDHAHDVHPGLPVVHNTLSPDSPVQANSVLTFDRFLSLCAEFRNALKNPRPAEPIRIPVNSSFDFIMYFLNLIITVSSKEIAHNHNC